MKTTNEDKTQIYWMIRRHVKRVLEIESQLFHEYAFDEAELLTTLKTQNVIGVVIGPCKGWSIFGYMIYELQETRIVVHRLAVDQQFHRQGYGRQCVERLIEKLSQQRRSEIIVDVPEEHLAAQLLFQRYAFHAEDIIKSDRVYYRMRHSLSKGSD